jgi:DNA topoisomerase-3
MTTTNPSGTPPATPASPPGLARPDPSHPLGAPCPKCGGAVHEQDQGYQCAQCEWILARVILQQPISADQATRLLATGKTDLLNGFVSRKTGRPFTAALVLREGRTAFEFSAEPKPLPEARTTARREPAAPEPAPDFTGQEPLGKCPRCGSRVFETARDYRCEHRSNEARPCSFQASKVILEQPVSRDQMKKLLAAGRSDLLPRFVSRKSGHPFAAFLVIDRSGKVSFAFPPRDKPPTSPGVVVRPPS